MFAQKTLSSENGRDVSIGAQDSLVKHPVPENINHVALQVHKEARLVHQTIQAVNGVPLSILQDRLVGWVEVSSNSLKVELCERENFRELSVLELALFPHHLILEVDDVASCVD